LLQKLVLQRVRNVSGFDTQVGLGVGVEAR